MIKELKYLLFVVTIFLFVFFILKYYFSDENIKKSNIKNLVITDTINNSEKVKNVRNIEVLTISHLVGEAIKRISNSTSVSDLFK